MKEDKSTHPYLQEIRSANRRNQALWNTNAGFPLSHLVHPEDLGGLEPLAPVDHAALSPSDPDTPRSEPIPEIMGLSPFTEWLLAQKPVSPGGMLTSQSQSSRPLAAPEVPNTEGKKKKKSKKKDKKKKDKKQKKVKKKDKKKKAVKDTKATGKPGVLDTGLVTDILADLTAEQGHYGDAIEMYRRLVNLHPERTAYYLEKIRSLRKEDSEE